MSGFGGELWGTSGCRCKDNVIIDLQETGLAHWRDWAGSGHRLGVRSCEYGNELSVFIKCGEFRDYVRK
jgi:hypothetical protein